MLVGVCIWLVGWLKLARLVKARGAGCKTLGSQHCPFSTPVLGGGFSSTEIDCRKKGALILTSLLEDLEHWVGSLDFNSLVDITPFFFRQTPPQKKEEETC